MDPIQRQQSIKKYTINPLIEDLAANISLYANQLTVCFINPNFEHVLCRQYRLTEDEASLMLTDDDVKSYVLSLNDIAAFAANAKYVFDNLTEDEITNTPTDQ